MGLKWLVNQVPVLTVQWKGTEREQGENEREVLKQGRERAEGEGELHRRDVEKISDKSFIN